MDALINEFEKRSKSLLDWCEINHLDTNWPKTFAMFITNKRIKLTLTISLNQQEIQVVQAFKLLGITIDNKLSFATYVANLTKQINQRLYSIIRLFYSSINVKLQFFKSFILPYFDYCCSLFIYFPKEILQKIICVLII